MEHDAAEFDPLQCMGTGPRVAMRALLRAVYGNPRTGFAKMDTRVQKFLFCDTWAEGTSKETFGPILRMALVERELVLPDPAHSWYPFSWTTGERVAHTAGPPKEFPKECYITYAALAMRIAILTAYCGNLAQAEREYDEEQRDAARKRPGTGETQRGRPSKASRGSYQATGDSIDDSSLASGSFVNSPAATKTSGKNSASSSSASSSSSSSSSDTGKNTSEPTSSISLLRCAAHFSTLCLDSHWLLACTFDNAGSCLPRDDSYVVRVALETFAPSDATAFHEGEVPFLDRRLMRCTFFGGASFPTGTGAGPGISVGSGGLSGRSEDPVVHMLSKSIPHRCEVREMIGIIENGCVTDEGTFYLFQSMLAASFLGVYRHARVRPGSFARHALYDLFFWHPSAALAEALVAHKLVGKETRSRDPPVWDSETLAEAFHRRQSVTLHTLLTGGQARRPAQAPLSGAAAKAVAETVPKRHRVSHDNFPARLTEHRLELLGSGSGMRNGRSGRAGQTRATKGTALSEETKRALHQHLAFPLEALAATEAAKRRDKETREKAKQLLLQGNPGSGARGEEVDLLAQRRILLFHWLTTTTCHADALAGPSSSGGRGKGPAKKGPPGRNDGRRQKIHKKEAFQDTMFIVVREFLIFQLKFLPHLRDTLCAKSDWQAWERSVVDGVDVLRGLTYSRHMETRNGAAPILPAAFSGFEVPSQFTSVGIPSILLHCADLERVRHPITNTLFEPHKPHVFDVFLHVYKTLFLDAMGGSELPVDAFLSPETEHVLWYAIVQGAWPRAAEITLRTGAPQNAREAEHWRKAGHFPLQLWHAAPQVIDRFLAMQKTFEGDAKREVIVQFLRDTARANGMYQVQLIAAFVQACIDRVRVRTVPLPEHLAKAQAHGLRQRFSLEKDDPLPRHTLSNFVCRRCRRFCGNVVRVRTARHAKNKRHHWQGEPVNGAAGEGNPLSVLQGQGAGGKREPVFVTWETASGAEHVLFATQCIDTRAKTAMRKTGHGVQPFHCMQCPEQTTMLTIFQKAAVIAGDDPEATDELPLHAANAAEDEASGEGRGNDSAVVQGTEDLPMFGALASDACMPTDPTLDTAPSETRVASAQAWLREQTEREHAAGEAFLRTVLESVPRAMRECRMPRDILRNATLPRDECDARLRVTSSVVLPGQRAPFTFDLGNERTVDDIELAFLRRWQGNLLVGNFPPPAAARAGTEEQVLWTCGSKQTSTEHKKLKTVSKRHANAVAVGNTVAAAKEALKLRRILRTRYEHSLCYETQLLEVDLLGSALRLDGTFVVVCCRCLGFTEFSEAAWRGDSVLCGRCDGALRALQRAGKTGDPAHDDACGVFVCRKCNRSQKVGQKYESLLVYDDISAGCERFVTIYFCPQHVANAAWAWGAPNILPLSAVDSGLDGKWRTLSRWNATQDYLRAYIFEKPKEPVEPAKRNDPAGSGKKRARPDGQGEKRAKRGRPKKSESQKK